MYDLVGDNKRKKKRRIVKKKSGVSDSQVTTVILNKINLGLPITDNEMAWLRQHPDSRVSLPDIKPTPKKEFFNQDKTQERKKFYKQIETGQKSDVTTNRSDVYKVDKGTHDKLQNTSQNVFQDAGDVVSDVVTEVSKLPGEVSDWFNEYKYLLLAGAGGLLVLILILKLK